MCICIVFFKIINDMRNRSKCKCREATTAELLMVIEFKQMVKIEVAISLLFLKSELMVY